MATMLNKIFSWLSTPRATFFIILASLLGRIIQLVFFYNIRVDASYQVMATMHFLDGHGVSFAEVPAQDLSQTLYTPLINWPPGYSFLLAPFYWLWNGNYIGAGISLDILAASLLIFSSRSLLKELNLSNGYINLFTLLSSFFIYSFYFIASSDAIAIAFFLAALYFALRIINKARSFLFWTALTTCLIIAALVKYLFIPIVFIVPLGLLWYAFSISNTRLRNAAWVSMAVLLAACGSLLLWQKFSTGSMGYISQPARGFFPAHLNDFYPYLMAAWIKPDTVNELGILSFHWILIFFKILHLLLLGALIICFTIYWKKNRFLIRSAHDMFFFLSFFLSIAITVLLAALSLQVAKEEIWPGVFWTYIEESRYYGLVYVLLHLLLIYLLSHRKRWGIPIALLLPFLLAWCVESVRGGLLVANRIRLAGQEKYSWQEEAEFQNQANEYIEKLKQEENPERTIITGSSYYMNHRVSLKSHTPILYNTTALNQENALFTKKEVLIFALIEEGKIPSFQNFLEIHQPRFVGQFKGFYFYALNVKPSQE